MTIPEIISFRTFNKVHNSYIFAPRFMASEVGVRETWYWISDYADGTLRVVNGIPTYVTYIIPK